MRYRRVGRTGMLVSELCLGTNTFGGDGPVWKSLGALEQPAVDAVVAKAVEGGINFIDTADMYAAGQSEECVGRAIRNVGVDRADVVIATKVGGRMAPGVNGTGASRGHMIRALDASLKRLATDYVDLYMVHYFDPATPLEETLRTLDGLVRAGKVRHIGCSNFAAWQVMKGLQVSAREGLERFEVIEANWSAATRGLEREVVPMALDQGVGVLVWGGLVGGLLSGKFNREGGDAGVSRTGGNTPPVLNRDQVFDVVDALRTVAARREASVAQTALAWLLSHKAVTSVLFGARNAEQVADNVKATDVVLQDDDMALIGAAAEPVMDYGLWSVRGSATARLQYV
ncbi:aldo/keto reductase [Phenylobacterium sp.]|uniref:aldo/keto reductase n=1 Tax=Phenylobacterium sp. TaxID=1871053 RepID=UPI002F40D97A